MGTINTTTNERFVVDYRITLNDGQDIKKILRICIEQTVRFELCSTKTH